MHTECSSVIRYICAVKRGRMIKSADVLNCKLFASWIEGTSSGKMSFEHFLIHTSLHSAPPPHLTHSFHFIYQICWYVNRYVYYTIPIYTVNISIFFVNMWDVHKYEFWIDFELYKRVWFILKGGKREFGRLTCQKRASFIMYFIWI